MKKITFLLITLFVLSSCGLTEQNINNNDDVNETERAFINDVTIEDLSLLSVYERANLDCNSIYSTDEYMNEDETATQIKFRNECDSIKQEAIKETEELVYDKMKRVQEFDISKCREVSVEKYSYLQDQQDTSMVGEKSYEELVNDETQYCEQAYAFQYGCDLLDTDEKVNTCVDMKEFQNKINTLENYKNFVIGNYLQ